MARGGGGSELWDVVGLAVVGIVAYFALSSGALDGILKSLTEGLKGLSIPSIPMPGGGGGGALAVVPQLLPVEVLEVVLGGPTKAQER